MLPDSSSATRSHTLEATESRSPQVRPPRGAGVVPTRVFEDDELVAFRYRIRGLLGRGGMGEVYEAEDLELRERVALKVLRRELAERPGALEQLKREIALARKVSHPNVCRLFDVGFHLRSGAGGSERICFLTMELLQGEPLSAVLRSRGRLAPDEVLPLARQLAEGLGAAHEAGIIHRDLKSANVLLVRAPTGATPRAVITDFGLARVVGEGSVEPVDSSARLVGTPAYMAPEQLEGGAVTPGTDLYALGVILFELLTGSRPFQGEDARDTALERLRRPAPSPRRFRPELEGRWEALILRCLERRPERRFADARAVLSALPAPRRVRQPSRPGARPLASLLAVMMGGLLAGARIPPPPPVPPLEKPVPALRSLALLGFEDRTGRPDTAWLSRQLTQALGVELRAGVPSFLLSSRIEVAKTALGMKDADPLTPDTLARLRGLLGCDVVVQGAYTVREAAGSEFLHLELRVLDTSTGEPLALVEESGPLRGLLPVVSRAGERIRQVMGVWGMSPLSTLERVLPSSLEALRLNNEAMEKLHQRDPAAAEKLFEQVTALEPAPSGPRSSLAVALVARGDRGRGRELLGKVLTHGEFLPPSDRLSLEALYTAYAPDWQGASERYRQLLELLPGDFEVGLSLGGAQLAARSPKEALATVERFRERSLPTVFAVLFDNLEAKAALKVADLPRAQAAASRAALQAEALSDWFSAAMNRSLEADALHAQGATSRAREALREAVRLFQRAGDRHSEAEATRKLAQMLPAEDLRGGLQVAREALALFRELGSASGECMTLLDVSSYQHSLGELRGALRSAREALPLCQGTRLPVLSMYAWNLLGRAQRSLGELPAAEASFREQLRLAREHQNGAETTASLAELVDLLLSRGELARARALHDEAQALIREDARRAPEDFALLRARLAFEEGRLEEAATLAEAAVTSVSQLSVPAVYLLQSRVFLAQDRYKEASAALLLAGEPAVAQLRLELRIQRARLSAMRGGAREREAALASLREILAEAERLGWHEGQSEARLALGALHRAR
ncbi:serine/threonine-protein kinase [Hyalangium gracile]|uniref:serine/threonine-protein kinase n=1 Tax=Hyalangium gracile TaxID=394092 RepID=UPI001CCB77E5|nr:serine/threonine-protein kinase [Hyalangium gracile]